MTRENKNRKLSSRLMEKGIVAGVLGLLFAGYNALGYKRIENSIERDEASNGRTVAVSNAREFVEKHDPVRSVFYYGFKRAAEDYLEENRD